MSLGTSLHSSTPFSLSNDDKTLFQRGVLSLVGIQEAYENSDARLGEYIVKLVKLDPAPKTWNAKEKEFYREDCKTAQNVIKRFAQVNSWQWSAELSKRMPNIDPGLGEVDRNQLRQTILEMHKEIWADLEKLDDDLVPERFKVHQVISQLWAEQSLYARQMLLQVIYEMPFKWGPWKALRSIFYQAIEKQDYVIFGALAARIDTELAKYVKASHPMPRTNPSFSKWGTNTRDVSKLTLAYMSRRAWRELRQTGISLPHDYAQLAVEVLRHYRDANSVYWQSTWLVSHILHHHSYNKQGVLSKHYNADKFHKPLYRVNWKSRPEQLKNRAFVKINPTTGETEQHLWNLDIRPLLKLAESAQSTFTFEYALTALIHDFADEIQHLEASFLERLVQSSSDVAQNFVYEWFTNYSKISDQAEFKKRGLQHILIGALRSKHDKFRNYAVNYVRNQQHQLVDDIGADQLMWLLRHEGFQKISAYSGKISKNSQKFSHTSWRPDLTDGKILPGDTLVVVNKYYKITKIIDRRNMEVTPAFDTTRSYLPWKIRNNDLYELGTFLVAQQAYTDKLTLALWTELLQTTLSFDFARTNILQHHRHELNLDWYQLQLKSKSSAVRKLALEWLNQGHYGQDDDVLGFFQNLIIDQKTPSEILGYALEMVVKGEDQDSTFFAQFSVEYRRALLVHPAKACIEHMLKWQEQGFFSFESLGLDFLKQLIAKEEWEQYKWVDSLGEWGKDWRTERAYTSTVNSSINQKGKRIARGLHDWMLEDVSLAELGHQWLIERFEHASSEYRFCKKIVDQRFPFAAFDEGQDPERGCAYVFDKILGEKNAYSTLANRYKKLLTSRHLQMRQERGEQDDLPEALQLPKAAVSFQRFFPMLQDQREGIRLFALKFAKHEITNWVVDEGLNFRRLRPYLIGGYEDIRMFFHQALERKQIDVENLAQFTPEDLYSYCYDSNKIARDLGIAIIQRYPKKYGLTIQLIKLASSSDRRIREMVVRTLWTQHRSRPITLGWQPYAGSVVPQSRVAKRRIKVKPEQPASSYMVSDLKNNEKYIGAGVSSLEEQRPASLSLQDFLRYVLFRLPPKPPMRSEAKRLVEAYPAWRNKHDLLVALRDVGLGDRDFAALILPLIHEFSATRGKTEFEACLVALTQLETAYPELNGGVA